MEFIVTLIIQALAGILAMWVHEVPKYYVGRLLTHPVYKQQEKTKLNLLKMIDPIGLILMVFMGIGWQMPIKMRANRFKNKEKGYLILASIGYLSSLIMVFAFGPLLRYYMLNGSIAQWQPGSWQNYLIIGLYAFVRYNVVIFVINLLPIPPFDMAKVIYSFSPTAYFKIIQNERMIQSFFVLFLIFGLAGGLVNVIWKGLALIIGLPA